MKHNIKLVNEVKDLASRKGAAPAQIALAWILTLSSKPGMPTIIPIPGGTTSDKVTQNLQGVPRLSDAEMAELDRILKENEVRGARY
jgi:pyridoxine 4-dehydrogenase